MVEEGVGSVGSRIDRGLVGEARPLEFRRVGRRVFARYRSVGQIASAGAREQGASTP